MDQEDPSFATVLRRVARTSHDVIEMVNGTPDWEPPPSLRDGLRDTADVEAQAFQYPPMRGLRPLREELADRRNVPTESVMVTAGATEANHIATAHALTRHSGDEIVIADPYYPYYPRRAEILGGTPVQVPVSDDGVLDPEAVAAVMGPETAAIVVNTPNNPTGAVYGLDVLQELVGLAEEHDALLISDETYGHLDLSGSFVSALSVDSDHRIVTNSMSKSLAITGLRVGYMISPTPHRERLFDRHELTTISASRPAQAAVLEALRETGPGYYEAVRDRLRNRRETFCSALDDAGATYTRPDMPFYVMANLPGLPGTLESVITLIEEYGVAPMPGSAFGTSRRDWLRFALVTPQIDAAATRLRDAAAGANIDG